MKEFNYPEKEYKIDFVRIRAFNPSLDVCVRAEYELWHKNKKKVLYADFSGTVGAILSKEIKKEEDWIPYLKGEGINAVRLKISRLGGPEKIKDGQVVVIHREYVI